jgi:hypothetical protein
MINEMGRQIAKQGETRDKAQTANIHGGSSQFTTITAKSSTLAGMPAN